MKALLACAVLGAIGLGVLLWILWPAAGLTIAIMGACIWFATAKQRRQLRALKWWQGRVTSLGPPPPSERISEVIAIPREPSQLDELAAKIDAARECTRSAQRGP